MYYEKLVAITKDYLGPAAERFIKRQIDFHLEKKPDALTREDVMRLAEWIQNALSLLTGDKEMVKDVAARIRVLAEN